MTKKFITYRSSAGSGKTYTLVKEYLKLVLQNGSPNYYRRILAITFTNKAAGEMKERVLSQLTKFAKAKKEGNHNPELLSDNDKQLLTSITNEINENTHSFVVNEVTILKRAENTLSHILHNYSDLSISTIDSFVHGIIRSFARDMNLDHEFEIALDQKKVIKNSIEILLTMVGKNKELTNLVMRFVNNKIDNAKSWSIQDDLEKFGLNIFKDSSKSEIEKLNNTSALEFKRIFSELNLAISSFENKVNESANRALEIINNSELEVSDFSRKTIPNFFQNSINKGKEWLKPNKTLLKMMAGEVGWLPKKSKKLSLVDEIEAEVTTEYNKIIALSESVEFLKYKLRIAIRKTYYSNSLLSHIDFFTSKWKTENNQVMISDFNKMISEIVLNNPAPFIYEKIGEQYLHILIDEFQDTAILQWQNFLPLIENSLAKGKFNMVVGDGKQAIYRWRDGEVMQFVNLPEIYKPISENIGSISSVLKANHQDKNLDTNYRSSKEIIEFNNQLYDNLSSYLGEYNTIYKNQAQKTGKNIEGLVSIDYYNGQNAEEKFEEKFEHILTHIEQSLQDNFELKDIAILCRNNKEGKEIAERLLMEKIPVITTESLLLKNNTRIKCLISLAKITINTKDEKAKVNFISHLSELGLLKNSLHQVLINYRVKSLQNERAKTSFDFHQFVNDNYSKIDFNTFKTKGCYEVFESFIALFEFNKEADNYLEFFLHSLMQDPSLTLVDFLEWWEDHEDRLGVGESVGSNGVRIMTIHKSKGLQFPIVIMSIENTKNNPANIWLTDGDPEIGMKTALININPNEENAQLSNKISEERDKILLDKFNLIYVATTRPEERLHLLINRPDSPKYEKTESLYEYLDDVFLKMDFGYDREKTSFIIGKRNKKEEIKEKTKEQAIVLESYISKPLLEGTSISFTNGDKWLEEDNNTDREYGIIVHQILAEIETENELNKNLTKKHAEGIVSKEQQHRISKELSLFLNDNEIKKWFDSTQYIFSKSEKELLTSSNKTLRPDKVIYFEKHIDVIDFKSGEYNKKHESQVLDYIINIQKTTELPVKGYVVYTKDRKIIPVLPNAKQMELF